MIDAAKLKDVRDILIQLNPLRSEAHKGKPHLMQYLQLLSTLDELLLASDSSMDAAQANKIGVAADQVDSLRKELEGDVDQAAVDAAATKLESVENEYEKFVTDYAPFNILQQAHENEEAREEETRKQEDKTEEQHDDDKTDAENLLDDAQKGADDSIELQIKFQMLERKYQDAMAALKFEAKVMDEETNFVDRLTR